MALKNADKNTHIVSGSTHTQTHTHTHKRTIRFLTIKHISKDRKVPVSQYTQ